MIVYYEESILSYVASMRNYFGLDSSYDSNKEFDKMLEEKKPNNIFLILVDAMGANQVKQKLPEDSFVRRNLKFVTSTVFPSTTSAATTAIECGRAPNENAWLGWNQYLKDIDDYVIPFLGKGYYSEIDYGSRYYRDRFPVPKTIDELNAIGIKAREIYPAWREDGCETFRDMTNRLVDYSYSNEYRYIYAYFDKYDSLLHMHGPESKITDDYLFYVNECLEDLEKRANEKTMFVVVADHGQVQIKEHYFLITSPLHKYLKRKPYIEPRACALDIIDGMEDEFEKEFKNILEDKFLLLNKKQILETHLFGSKKSHPYFEELLPDFIALAKANTNLEYYVDEESDLNGHHAGMTEDEMLIPVVIYQK